MNFNARLIISIRGEYLGFACWNRCVAVDHFGEYAACGFDTEGQRSYVEQHDVFNVTCQYAGLNCRSKRNHFVRVYAFVRLFACQFLNRFLYGRNTSGTADKDDFVNIVSGQTCIAKRLTSRAKRTLYQGSRQFFEFSTSQVDL